MSTLRFDGAEFTPPPGMKLREAHAHLPALGREMTQLSLHDCISAPECVSRVAALASRMESAREPGWLLASGVRVSGWKDQRWPFLTELDRACPNRPCLLGGFDHHSGVCNSAALAAAGLSASSSSQGDGLVVRTPEGEATGLVLEAAFEAVRRAVPEPTPEQWLRHIKAACDSLASLGFVEVHDLLSPVGLGESLAKLDDSGHLPLRVWLYPALADLGATLTLRGRFERPGAVTVAGAKLFADGTLNSRTAWMLSPYRDPMPGHERGTPLISVKQLAAAIDQTRAAGVGLAVHAIGDGAVRAVLDAAASRPAPRGSPTLRIEHCELIDATDLPRFSQLGVIASIQPCHLLPDIDVLKDQLPHRLDRVLPLRELIDSGCRPGELLWFGSDVPIVRADPSDSVAAAVLRRRPGMTPEQAVAPEQAITESEAWRCFSPTPP
ncbi:MAG: amidohydrolase family protein [Planctomycetes bacterium]|nr:amidohydrolase family protein [Planctomycetota bacterium]